MADVFRVMRGGFRSAKGHRKSDQDKVLAPKEFQALLNATHPDLRRYGRDAYDLFAITGNYGLRCTEAISLERDDFKTIAMGYFRVHTLKKRAKEHDRIYAGRDGQALSGVALNSGSAPRGASRFQGHTS